MATTCAHVNTPAVCEDKAWHYAFLSEGLSDLFSPWGPQKYKTRTDKFIRREFGVICRSIDSPAP